MQTIERLQTRIHENPVGVGVTGLSFTASAPASTDELRAAEDRLGFSLPPLLAAVYIRVANGGIGPGYGLIGLPGGFADDQGDSVVSLYEAYRMRDPEDPTWAWPRGLLPICHWGCVVYSAVDCLLEGNPVVFADVGNKEPESPMTSILIPHKPTLASWFDAWLDGHDLWGEVWGTS